ncbi:MAG: exodeoxyribonuclease VII small subunit [Candidatus Fermentibacter sp.]|nr:exodeoxyribonuclease VII small subunit [Candidatus Fermentibacter sp.]
MSRRKGPSFEEQMEELTAIVDGVGREDCPLDELESRVRRAAGLIRELRARLASTEMSVREVLDGLAADRRARDARPGAPDRSLGGQAADGAGGDEADEDEDDEDDGDDEDGEDDPED